MICFLNQGFNKSNELRDITLLYKYNIEYQKYK